ncbi:nitrate- and nitrite sensing domain-containing protein [Sphaerimonospora mesophila]|uniref:sensor histidine kinase n=1 Tax=Sphaerimonospora mesophila TaxID=37483 RepID=UPI001F41C723
MRTATIEGGRRADPEPPGGAGVGGATTTTSGRRPPGARTGSSAGHATGSPMALKNWRVRSRLLALIVLPTVVAVLLGGLRVITSIGSAAEYQRVRGAVELVARIGTLAQEIQLERDLSVRYVAGGRRSNSVLTLINNQHKVVDAAVELVRSKAASDGDTLGELGRAELSRALGRLTDLPALRKIALESQLQPLRTLEKYRLVTADLLRLYDAAGQGVPDEALAASIKALGALARAQEAVSQQRALLALALARQRFEQDEFDAFTAAAAGERSELTSFNAEATIAQRQYYADTVTNQLIDRARFFINRARFLNAAGLPIRNLDRRSSDEERWFAAISKQADLMREVSETITKSAVTRSAELQAAERNAAVFSAILITAVLLLVLLITAVMARSLVHPLRRLRSEALEVAGRRLPELVQRLRDADGGRGRPEVQPIGVHSADEIGEVARAFDEVHREAVRLAGDEAQLRSNINAMFVNLSRRTQTLVERQITLIDGLEQGEQDERRLADMFKLDHLATRMRRNSENLLVLAGQEPARRWSRPVEITDVLRASLSEVEGYERVALNVPGDVAIAGQSVNDVIHLLAELVENALSFSARDTRVTVSGNSIDGGGVMISITDSGIGMTNEEIAQANHRLSNPPVVDVSVSRRMGLFVVGRLALRNGIRVQLRPHDGGGLTAMVLLPEALMSRPAYQPPAHGGAFAPSWSPQSSLQPSQSEWPARSPIAPRSAMPPSAIPPAAPTAPLGHNTGPHFTPAAPHGGAGMRPRRHDDVPDEAATGPMPVLRNAPLEEPPEEFLPIFASVESAWFKRTTPTEAESEWQRPSAVDAGWQTAAAVAQQPASDGKTTSGLPKRVPKANLVPGSADAAAASAAPPPPVLSPDRARSRLSSFQQGVRQGRAVARGEISEDQGYPMREGEQR